MGTIKEDRKDLEMLLNGISSNTQIPGFSQQNNQSTISITPSSGNTSPTSVVDNTKDGEFGVEKLFDYTPDSLKKGIRKKCRKTILNIVNHILPDNLVQEDYVQDKIEQDIDTLTDLYFQQEVNVLMQNSLVISVSRGNVMPRYYEVFGQLTDKIQSINKQILNTEQTIRKTYIDLKFEIRDKENEMGHEMMNKGLASSGQNKPQGVLISSSKDLIEMAKKKHKEDYIKNKINDISYTEIVENND